MKLDVKLHSLLRTLVLASVFIGGTAGATTLVLEGSDATTFHGDFTYTTQLLSFMQEGSPLPVAVFRNPGDGALLIPVATPVVYLDDLSTLDTATYSALYIMSPDGCCGQNLAGASLWATEIGAFYDGGMGGSVAIQDYTGGDWSFIDAVLATPPAGTVLGFDTGMGGPICTDLEVVNAEGLAKGFTQPPVLGCWEHQAYSNTYFGALGFLSLYDADPAYSAVGDGGTYSGLLALGGALGTPSVPEPTTLGLIGLGLLGLRMTKKRGMKAI